MSRVQVPLLTLQDRPDSIESGRFAFPAARPAGAGYRPGMTPLLRRTAAAGFALLALGLGACEEDTDDVTNDPVDQSSSTPPEEGGNGSEEDTGGVNDDN